MVNTFLQIISQLEPQIKSRNITSIYSFLKKVGTVQTKLINIEVSSC